MHKGPNLTGIDPDSGDIVPLFNPREDDWDTHFARRGALVVGLTPRGRATVIVLNMNELANVDLRSKLIAHGQLK